MTCKFIGEGSKELKDFPRDERHQIFKTAALRSYRHASTWFGLVVFIIIMINAVAIASWLYSLLNPDLFPKNKSIALFTVMIHLLALVIIARFQQTAINKEIRKIKNFNK